MFDLGSTHSHLSLAFAKKLGMHASTLPFVLNVPTPVGKQAVCNFFYPKCNVKIGEFTVPANLIVLDMRNFNVVLGMDWLASFHMSMYCFGKTITFKLDLGNALFEGTKRSVSTNFISVMRA